MFHFIMKAVTRCFSKYIKPTILFESVPDFSDNSRAVYDVMIRRGLEKKYYLDWIDNNNEIVELKQGIPIWSFSRKPGLRINKRVRGYSAANKLVCKICCNRFLQKNDDLQFVMYLSHGTPIKSIHNYYYVPEHSHTDAVLSAGKEFVDILSYELRFPRDRIVPLGFPRNDVLTSENKIDIKSFFEGDYDKVIIWYPTYRQHKNGTLNFKEGPLLIIESNEDIEALNSCLATNNILLVIKPHFAQNLAFIKKRNLSNIRYIDDSFYAENHISAYQFLAGCDALVSDYSSVIFDYLLCNKPIGLIWNDFEDYKINPGFAIDVDRYTDFAEKIFSTDDLIDFVNKVSSGMDDKEKLRQSICSKVNISSDGKNAERVINFILTQIQLLNK